MGVLLLGFDEQKGSCVVQKPVRRTLWMVLRLKIILYPLKWDREQGNHTLKGWILSLPSVKGMGPPSFTHVKIRPPFC